MARQREKREEIKVIYAPGGGLLVVSKTTANKTYTESRELTKLRTPDR